MNIIFFILLLTFCIYFIYLFNKSIRRELDNINIDIQRQEELLVTTRDKNKTLKEKNAQLENSLNEVVAIYEYVKKLGSTLDFSEAVSTLEGVLTSLWHFTDGKLILIEGHNISKIYKITSTTELDRNINVSSLKEYEKKIVTQMVKNPQTILCEKTKLTPIGILPNGIQTLLALPLTVEKQLVGIIILENIPLVNIDKIHLITLQFAMEVKKTQLYERVKELSTIDGLTGLYQRRHFTNLLANELDRGYRQNQPMGFLMIDVDHFKRYNDEYGHLVGDLILKRIANILKERSREIDLLCRYGGDEFALALPRTTPKDAYTVAERLRRAVNEYLFQVANEQFQVTISIGLSSCNPKDMRLDGISETLIDLADKALYRAKQGGRNRVVVSE